MVISVILDLVDRAGAKVPVFIHMLSSRAFIINHDGPNLVLVSSPVYGTSNLMWSFCGGLVRTSLSQGHCAGLVPFYHPAYYQFHPNHILVCLCLLYNAP